MNDRKIAGICLWLSDRFGIDEGGLRILFIAAAVLGLGSPILVYFILYLLKPSEY